MIRALGLSSILTLLLAACQPRKPGRSTRRRACHRSAFRDQRSRPRQPGSAFEPVCCHLTGRWQINVSPTLSYNHKADSNSKWTFPLAIGVSRTMIIEGRPWKSGVQHWHYVQSPDTFGPDYQPRSTVTPGVKLPW